MPELPEVETVVRELHRKLSGRIIESVKVLTPKIVSLGPKTLSPIRSHTLGQAKKFEKLLDGQKIVAVKRRAKLLIFALTPPSLPLERGGISAPSPWFKGELEGVKLFLLVHLKMTGQFIFEDESLRKRTQGKYRVLNKLAAPLHALPYKHTHVVFKFTDGSTLYFNDVRKFGYLKLVTQEELKQVKEPQEYGPEPLSKEFTHLILSTNVEKFKCSVKQALMDSRVVAGIGNIYSDEILFHAKVRPDRKVGSLTDSELKKIYDNIALVLKKGIVAKGSSVGDFVRTDGSWGRMGKFHFVYGRGKQKCKVCTTIIQSAKIGGRTGSWCPKCQR